MPLYSVRLEMAREPAFPHGNPNRGYILVLPLDQSMKIDPAEWKANRQACTVERFWDGERTELGYLERHRRGQWVFDYDFDDDEDEEAGFRLGEHAFNRGEYVSIAGHDGDMHTFTVVSVVAI
ncbi:hypothetical protein [Oricola sp.]|uniref:hypothetical protein n=1 Tax=Oricola sp. TaxID=1979950 RepID=UPI003BAD63AD